MKGDGDFDQGRIGADDEKQPDHGFYFEVRAERTYSGYGYKV